jgi:putative FmdB family regulatory protein
MPTYRYRCEKDGEEFELWQSIHDDALTRHPGCEGKVTRVLAPAGIVLKGSGFYRTDSRAGSRKSGSGEPKESKESTESKDKEPSKERAASGNGSGDAKSTSGSKDSAGTKSEGSTGSKESKPSKSGPSST